MSSNQITVIDNVPQFWGAKALTMPAWATDLARDYAAKNGMTEITMKDFFELRTPEYVAAFNARMATPEKIEAADIAASEGVSTKVTRQQAEPFQKGDLEQY